jgi:hypothetical protein
MIGLLLIALSALGMDGVALPGAADFSYSCGDYSLLSDKQTADRLSENCNVTSSAQMQKSIPIIESLDPVAEAKAAAKRGDFRIAAIVSRMGDPSAPPWITPAVQCAPLQARDISILATFIEKPGLSGEDYQRRLGHFAMRFNRAIVTDRLFPASRRCEVEPRYLNSRP